MTVFAKNLTPFVENPIYGFFCFRLGSRGGGEHKKSDISVC